MVYVSEVHSVLRNLYLGALHQYSWVLMLLPAASWKSPGNYAGYHDFEVLNNDERSSSVTADNVEFRDISKVNIVSSDENKCTVLFDSKHSIEDKILNEQFNY